MKLTENKKGFVLVLALVFGSIFMTIVFGLVGFVYVQNKGQIHREHKEQANRIAEAGLNYYKWYLSHNPDDLYDGNGATSTGPYIHDFVDPEGGNIGKFSLNISGVTECSAISSIEIESTGWLNSDSGTVSTVHAKYARPSVGEYAYVLNSSVWAGSSREIYGPYHSNGGIRMDGINHSVVTSGVEDWTCTSSFGCSPNQTVEGVFGSGSGNALWKFPEQTMDFIGLTLDLVNIKNLAQSDGVYLAPLSGGDKGYHLVFNSDDTFDVYRITNLGRVRGYSSDEGWHWDYHIINNESFVANYAISSDCSVVFAENDLWIDGIISRKVSVVSADLINPSVDTTTILNGNITYTAVDGSVGLTLVSEYNVLIPPNSPEDMELRGIYIAQSGHFGRNHYSCSSYPSYCDKNSLTINGTIVSNGRVGTAWSYGGGAFASGYRNRYNSYDRALAVFPPPLTPTIDDEYQFIQWREGEFDE